MTKRMVVYVEPKESDVLCGRRAACYNHKGNVEFRKIIEQTLSCYAMSRTKSEKTSFVQSVLREISDGGGRFLKFDKTVKKWYEGDSVCAKSKVGHAFRDAMIALNIHVDTSSNNIQVDSDDTMDYNSYESDTGSNAQSEVSDGVASLLLLGKKVVTAVEKKPSDGLSDGIKSTSSLSKKVLCGLSRNKELVMQEHSKPSDIMSRRVESCHKMPIKLRAKRKKTNLITSKLTTEGLEDNEYCTKKNDRVVSNSICFFDNMGESQKSSVDIVMTTKDEFHKTQRKNDITTSSTQDAIVVHLSEINRGRLAMIDGTALKRSMLKTLALRQEALQRYDCNSSLRPLNALQQVSHIIETAKAATRLSSAREIVLRAIDAQMNTTLVDSIVAVGAGRSNITMGQTLRNHNVVLLEGYRQLQRLGNTPPLEGASSKYVSDQDCRIQMKPLESKLELREKMAEFISFLPPPCLRTKRQTKAIQ
mmetsp:Transcript_27858/g.41113  ORF Transcript_27858/g.41113 Transcript_27858/m.41113 type:complete len:476 (+) Transcript_27858:111-1538(+)